MSVVAATTYTAIQFWGAVAAAGSVCGVIGGLIGGLIGWFCAPVAAVGSSLLSWLGGAAIGIVIIIGAKKIIKFHKNCF